jgi:osmotically-inducible protein OsmY
MSTVMLTQSDLRVRDSVLHELMWDSELDASAIGVTARNGAVTLTGFIDSYAGKLASERAAKRVRGVRAVANDIQVRLRLERTDPEIAGDAARSLSTRATLPEKVQAVVHEGHVTLTGSVPTLFQRAIAERAVQHIRGIKGIVNRIEIEPIASPKDVQRELVRALHRDADINARSIDVTVTGNKVRLTGTVGSWHEREAAEQAASHATGIAVVDNQIGVRLDEGPSADSYELC